MRVRIEQPEHSFVRNSIISYTLILIPHNLAPRLQLLLGYPQARTLSGTI
eukprot:m.153992 g.153992  ORF g.153992 m.153992 type:complete len:50 (+) comp14360_c0_seq5:1104-1253(+)